MPSLEVLPVFVARSSTVESLPVPGTTSRSCNQGVAVICIACGPDLPSADATLLVTILKHHCPDREAGVCHQGRPCHVHGVSRVAPLHTAFNPKTMYKL